MTDEEKIEMTRVFAQETDTDSLSDAVVSTYLTLAGQKIIARAYPYDDSVTEVPTRYQVLQCEIAAYLINKRGAEGETAHSEIGVSRNYGSADVPKELINQVVPHIGVIK